MKKTIAVFTAFVLAFLPTTSAFAISDGAGAEHLVLGDVGSSTGDLLIYDWDGTTATATNPHFVVENDTGQVGIGTAGADPDALLDIESTEDVELIRLSDTTNGDSTGIYTGTGTPNGALNAEAGSLFLDQAGTAWINTDGATAWSEVSSMADNFDEVYAESVSDGDVNMEIDDASGLQFDLTTTGDFQIEDNGTAFASFLDDGTIVFNDGSTATGDFSVEGDNVTDALFVDVSADSVGFGTATPAGQVETEVADTENRVGLIVDQDDTTNNLNAMEVQNAGTGIGTFIDQDGNGIALSIDAESTTTTVVDIAGATTTTGTVLNIAGANALTSGRVALLASDSADVTARNVVDIVNDNAAAVGAVALNVQQDSTGDAINVTGTTGIILDATKTAAGQWLDFNDGTDNFGVYNNAGTPEGAVAADIGSVATDTTNGALYIKTTDTVNTGWEMISAGADNFDEVYQESVDDGDVNMEIDDASGLQFDLTTTGNFQIEDNGTAFASFFNDGTVVFNDGSTATGDFSVEGDNVTDALYVDVSADSVGFGTITPGAQIETEVDDTENRVGLIVDQNDVTNNLNAAEVQNAGTGIGVFIDQDGNGQSLNIDSEATTANVVDIAGAASTTGNVLNITGANALTTGGVALLASDSADTGTRNVVSVVNDNTLATGATAFNVQQDAAQNAVFIDQNADGIALNIDAESTTATVVDIAGATTTTGTVLNIAGANGLTTGRVALLASDSADVSARNVVDIVNDNAAAVGAVALNVQQDSTGDAINVTGTTGVILDATKTASGQWLDFNDGTDNFGVYNNAGTPEGVVAADIGSVAMDTTNGALYIKTTDTVNTGWEMISAGADNFDEVYQESVDDGDVNMEIDDASGLQYDLTTTGDFQIEDNGTAFASFLNDGTIVFNDGSTATGDFSVEGDNVTDAFFVDVSADSVGIGTATPAGQLETEVADTENRVGLIVDQDDTTNNLNAMEVQNAGTGIGTFIDQDGNGIALSIDAESTTTTVVDIAGATTTTGTVLNIAGANGLTTGRVALLASDSADTGTRNVVDIVNDNALATGATALNVQQDSTGDAINVTSTTGDAINVTGTTGIILDATKTASGQWLDFNDGTDNFGVYNNAGTPEGVVAADIGSVAMDTTNGALYIKTTDTVNTGWEMISAGADNFDEVYQESVDDGDVNMEIDDASGLQYDLTTTGDFQIEDNGTAFASFLNDGTIVFNDGSTATGDFSVEGDNVTDAFFVDVSADSVGIGTATPAGQLETEVADTENRVGLIVDQDDTTNNLNAMEVQNAGTGIGTFIDQDGNGIALSIDAESTTTTVVDIAGATTTTGTVLNIAGANALTSGRVALLASDSADVTARNVVDIVNDNAAAVGATALNVQQDSTGDAINVTATTGIVMDATKTAAGQWLDFNDGTDNFGVYNNAGTPEGAVAADIGSIAFDTTNGAAYIKTTDTVNTGWELLSSDVNNFDEVYQESVDDGDVNMEIDDASGLQYDLTTTGNFQIEDNGSAFASFNNDATIVFNDSAAAGGNFTVEGETENDLLTVDADADTSKDDSIDNNGGVGIGTATPNATLEVDGSFAMTPDTTQTVGAAGTIDPTSSVVRVQSTGGAVTGVGIDTTDVAEGQLLTIIGGSNTNTFRIDDSGTVNLSRNINFRMGLADSLTLVFENGDWNELRRSNN